MKAVLPIVWNVWAIKLHMMYCVALFLSTHVKNLFSPIMTLIVTLMAYGLACGSTRTYLKKEKFAGI